MGFGLHYLADPSFNYTYTYLTNVCDTASDNSKAANESTVVSFPQVKPGHFNATPGFVRYSAYCSLVLQ